MFYKRPLLNIKNDKFPDPVIKPQLEKSQYLPLDLFQVQPHHTGKIYREYPWEIRFA